MVMPTTQPKDNRAFPTWLAAPVNLLMAMTCGAFLVNILFWATCSTLGIQVWHRVCSVYLSLTLGTAAGATGQTLIPLAPLAPFAAGAALWWWLGRPRVRAFANRPRPFPKRQKGAVSMRKVRQAVKKVSANRKR